MARPKGRKVYKGEKDDGVWKSDVRWDRSKDTGPGTGWVKDKDIPRAQKEPYRNRPGAVKEEKAMWDSYRKATKGRKGNRETK